MSTNTSTKLCTHIKVNGIRCGSPSLRGEQFCYFHQRMVRGVRTPPNSRLHPIALIEDPQAIQASLMEVINALARNTIDLKRAELIIRALSIAARNARNTYFGVQTREMVTQIPDYPAPAPAPEPQKSEFDLPPVTPAAQKPPRELTWRERWELNGQELDRQSRQRAAAEAAAAAAAQAATYAPDPDFDPSRPKPPASAREVKQPQPSTELKRRKDAGTAI
jgi:hypothetical protein